MLYLFDLFTFVPLLSPNFLRPQTFFVKKSFGGTKKVKVRPRMAARAHRVLTIEVWHQTSGRKGTNNLRDDQLVPAGIDMQACHRKCVTLLR